MHINSGNMILLAREVVTAQNIKSARSQDMFVSFVNDVLFENNADVKYNIRNYGIKPENVWIISYNNDAINDHDLLEETLGRMGRKTDINFYKEYFRACSFRANNYATAEVKTPEQLVDLISQTSDVARFFDFLKSNQDIYSTEAIAEDTERNMRGDDLDGLELENKSSSQINKTAQNLEAVKTPEKFTDRELTRAIRDAIIAEEGAIKQYETVVDATDNELAKKVLTSVANEEKIHVGELQKLLNILLPDEKEKLEQGEKEVEDERE